LGKNTQLETIDNVQSRGIEIWHEKKAQFGDTEKAREKTIEEIKKMRGVKDSGSEGGVSIWIEYNLGGTGSLMLQPEGVL